MKKILLFLLLIILVFCLVLWMKGNTTREISTEIVIQAPVEKVWQVLTDINGWNDWNPITNQASGEVFVGSELALTMRGEEGADGPKYNPAVVALEQPKLFEWQATMGPGFVFTNGRVFVLEKTSNGTRLTNKETFRGMLVPLFWSKLNDHVPAMLNEMNVALKNKVETGSN